MSGYIAKGSMIFDKDGNFVPGGEVAAMLNREYVPGEDISEACQIMRQVFNDVRLVDLQFDNLDRRMQTFIDKHSGISPNERKS